MIHRHAGPTAIGEVEIPLCDTADLTRDDPRENEAARMFQTMSLYEQLGGEEMVTRAVTSFYRRVMGDSLLAPFFVGMDMERQMAMQRAFLTTVFGGPGTYTGRGMRNAHARLVQRGLGDAHFNAVLSHLDDTLAELDISPPLRNWARAITESLRKDILGR
jgi:hemoglobin